MGARGLAATDPHQMLVVELLSQRLRRFLVHPHPIGYRRNRGPAPRVVADLLVKRAAELKGTRAGDGQYGKAIEASTPRAVRVNTITITMITRRCVENIVDAPQGAIRDSYSGFRPWA
jgi:hypothetical protein